jgi:hypothetical protein
VPDNIGYNGRLLQVNIECDRKDAIPLTVPHLIERLELLRNASTHSSKFLATQVNHLTNNDHFIAVQMNVSGKDIKELLKVKRQQMKAIELNAAAQAVGKERRGCQRAKR